MEKTKLGISVCLLGALVFLSGYLGITAVALVAGYVLLKEESAKLKKYAAYAVALFVGFLLVSMCISVLDNVFDVINFKSWMYGSDFYSVFSAIISLLNYIVSLAEKVVFGLLAVAAFFDKEVKIAPLDKFLEKHF